MKMVSARRVLAGVLFGCALGAATSAQAVRVAIDQNPDGTATSTTVSGYCDFNGDECDLKYGLPYQVNFGDGWTSQYVLHGNGTLKFVGDVDPGGTLLDPFLIKATVTAGLNDTTDFSLGGNFSEIYLQSARTFLLGDRIFAEWFVCQTPQNCKQNPYSALLTPYSDGYHVTVKYAGLSPNYFGGLVVGYSTPTVTDEALLAQTPLSYAFVIPASFNGLTGDIPEPSTWVMMISGLAICGAALRKRAHVSA